MKYYSKEEFIEVGKVSRSTVDRFYRKHKAIGKERKINGKRKDIPETHLRYFHPDLMIKEEQAYIEKIKKLKELLSLIRDKDTLASVLWHKDWVYFGTISYKEEFSKNTCYNKMTQMFNQLKGNIENSGVELFFTTESYEVRGGNHNHFVIDCNAHCVDEVNKFITDYSKWHRVDLEKYNPEEAGIFYIMKDRPKGTDWDYLI